MKRLVAVLALCAALLLPETSRAGVSCSLPFNLTNGTTADATQVMANYNQLVTCLGNAAAAGVNSDITALLALATPIAPSGGGTNTWIGGTTTGSAAAQALTTTIPSSGFALTAGYRVVFVWGFTTTAGLTLNVNATGATTVLKRTTGGLVAIKANDGIVGQLGSAIYDGTQWELDGLSSFAYMTQPDQTLSGGANVTSVNLGTPAGSSTQTIDCGTGPLQFLTNNAAFTIAAPSNDGACDILITNGASAGAITQSGFTVGSNTGEPLTTTNTNKFIQHIERINGVSTYMIKALQ